MKNTDKTLLKALGPNSKPARTILAELAQSLGQTGTGRIADCYQEWTVKKEALSAPPGWLRLARSDKMFAVLERKLLPKGLHVTVRTLLFCLETYFALIVKLATAHCFGSKPLLEGSLRLRMTELESGDFFRAHGICNFPGITVYDWYLSTWSRELDDGVRQILRFWENALPHLPLEADILGPLYASFFPAPARRRLGEHYTPGLVASHTVWRALGNLEKRNKLSICDPTCGSGTFLMQAIRWLREHNTSATPAQMKNILFDQVAGFDINPMAVLTARANFLLAAGDLYGKHEEASVSIPVEECDALLAPPNKTYDVLVGNPPWLNWEGLSPEYRKRTLPLWSDYGLFPHKGMDVILGKGKKDLAMLAYPVLADRLLGKGGRIAMVIPSSLLQGAHAGAGFRKFRLPGDKTLAPRLVLDWTDLGPFGPTLKAVVLVSEKEGQHTYPVNWEKAHILKAARSKNSLGWDRKQATPVTPCEPGSAWLVTFQGRENVYRKVLGRSDYRAHAGAYSGGANAVYWVDRLSVDEDGLATVRNRTRKAKNKVPEVEAQVEDSLLYPLLRSGCTQRWQAEPDAWMIIPQDPEKRKGLLLDQMVVKYPHALAYFNQFRDMLENRAAFQRYFRPTDPYWSIFDVGKYTFSKWKVVWPSMGKDLRAAVIGKREGRIIVPQHTVTLLAVNTRRHAHFLCGLINSGPPASTLAAFSPTGSKGFGCPHILERIRIPAYIPGDPVHEKIADLSIKAHTLCQKGDQDMLVAIENQLLHAVKKIWKLTDQDLELLGSFL